MQPKGEPENADYKGEPHVRRPLSDYRAKMIRKAIITLVRRRTSALAMYEPLEHARPFHERRIPERVLRGSNRSGKTIAAAIEVARALTGQDPHGKYPKENGRAFLVGKDGVHLATVMYRKLFRAGAYRMIRDEHTNMWRSYKPWLDAARRHESKPAPPLIPNSLIKPHGIGWEDKRLEIPRVVRMRNGWEAHFFSSLGKPPQGQDLDLAWFDEEIVDPQWYPEIAARLIDHKGLFLWSATPQAGSDELFDLHEASIEEQGKKKPRVLEIFMHIRSNPHMSEDDIALFSSKIRSDAERRVRIEGEFALKTFTVYPEFNMGTHGVEPFAIPATWTRYAVIDPGRQVCAVLFAAIPPDHTEHGGKVFLYDELYIINCSAQKFGEWMKMKCHEQPFHAFIIDHQESQKRETASGRTIEEQYSAELKKHGVRSATTGYGFHWGSTDVAGGIEKVRGWLDIRADGRPTLLVMQGKLPHLEYEFQRYRYKRDPASGMPTDKPDKRNDHALDSLRYLAQYGPTWRAPQMKPGRGASWARDEISKKKRLMQRGNVPERDYVRLGPGGKS